VWAPSSRYAIAIDVSLLFSVWPFIVKLDHALHPGGRPIGSEYHESSAEKDNGLTCLICTQADGNDITMMIYMHDRNVLLHRVCTHVCILLRNKTCNLRICLASRPPLAPLCSPCKANHALTGLVSLLYISPCTPIFCPDHHTRRDFWIRPLDRMPAPAKEADQADCVLC
jgi:hypothetical protein